MSKLPDGFMAAEGIGQLNTHERSIAKHYYQEGLLHAAEMASRKASMYYGKDYCAKLGEETKATTGLGALENDLREAARILP